MPIVGVTGRSYESGSRVTLNPTAVGAQYPDVIADTLDRRGRLVTPPLGGPLRAPLMLCGWECGFSWQHLPAGGAGTNWSSTGPAVDAFGRNGGHALRLTAPAGTDFVYVGMPTCETSGNGGAPYGPLIATPRVAWRFYFQFVTLPLADVPEIAWVETFNTATGTGYHLSFQQSTGKLLFGKFLSQQVGPAVTAGVWYRIDIGMDCKTASATLNWQVDGLDQPTATGYTDPTDRIFQVGFGAEAQNPAAFDCRYDDAILSGSLDDYPIGPGTIRGYRVQAVSGTHVQTAGDLKDQAGTNLTNGDNSGNDLNETAFDTTTYVQQPVVRATTYAEHVFAITETDDPRAVQQVYTVANLAGTVANDEKMQLYDGNVAADVFPLANVGSTFGATEPVRSKEWGSTPSGAPWTAGGLGTLRSRWGFRTLTSTSIPAMSLVAMEAEFLDTAVVATVDEYPFIGGGFYPTT